MPRSIPVFISCALLLVGCGQEDIRVYRVAKSGGDAPVPSTNSAAAANPAEISPATAPRAAGSGVQWKAPSGWQEGPKNPMRVGSFVVKSAAGNTAEVSVVPLPGIIGTELDNVNRWRRELNLGPIEAADLKAVPIMVDGNPAKSYVMENAEGGAEGKPAKTVAVLLNRDGTSWFFKLKGALDAVRENEGAFKEFLGSVRFGESAESTRASREITTATPTSAPLPAVQADPNAPRWTVPGNWKSLPGSQMVFAKFQANHASDPNRKAEISVSVFGGTVGGALANVNRWRGQLGLTPIQEGDLARETSSVDLPEGKAMLVDIQGTDARSGQPARLVALMVPRANESWFYKLMGDAQVVESEKDRLIQFVRGVEYPKR
jgi:hypothetical protein